jgi:Fe(3+) dicitrate transport protein
VELGFRVHGDGEDRFQWVDRHRFEGGALAIELAGTPGTDANRVDRARAVAGFAQADVTLGKWTVTPGVRVEHIALSRDDFGRADPLRTGSSLTAQSNFVTAVIPGVGVLRRLSGRVEVFGGVHRGFAPPDSRDETRPESSINLEGGFRFAAPHASVQTAAYYAGYSNLLGSDLAATGGSGSGDRFNAGAVDVVGLEIAVNADLGAMAAVTSWSFPARAAYTFTRGTFRESFASTFADWGNVDAGDALPYLAPHQLTVAVGAARGQFRGDVIGGYVAAMRAEAGRGAIPDNQRIESHVVIDVAAEVSLPRGVAAFARIANILDETYLAARRPAGLRPGLPRTAVVGLRVGI